MKLLKRLRFLIMALLIACPSGFSAYAANNAEGYRDMDSTAWYYEAVDYCAENGIMNGVEDDVFSPYGELTRAMLVSTLYRVEGSPTVEENSHFEDVALDAWYTDAVNWAWNNGVVGGYDEEHFAPNDPITREDTAAIIWRLEGSPVPGDGVSFADENQISDYAVNAVNWARENGVINGRDGNVFAPKDRITRAETAVILYNWLSSEDTSSEGNNSDENTETIVPNEDNAENENILIAYFSRTGNTEGAAEAISEITGGDIFEIVPVEAYPEDYNACLDIAQAEQDEDARPEISGTVENMDDYDVVILGFPIWFGDAPMIIRTFLESYDFSDKTIAPFSTSGSSGISGAVNTIERLCPDAVVTDGLSITSGELNETDELAAQWIDEIGIMSVSQDDSDDEQSTQDEQMRQLRITFDGNVLYAELEDNVTADDFAEMLPITLEFEDYNSSEKISYPSETLVTEDERESYQPQIGDLCLYEPWGNICFFYGSAGATSDLVPIAHLESGINEIADINDGTEITIELA